jgi:hypothetical protein
MIAKDPQLDSQISSTSFNPPEFFNPPEQSPHLTSYDECSLNFPASPSSTATNQKIEITFVNGHRFCLEGSFDWDIISTWLTPLLTQE